MNEMITYNELLIVLKLTARICKYNIMCNIEITLDFPSRNIYINNSDVFTRLHDYYLTTYSRFV